LKEILPPKRLGWGEDDDCGSRFVTLLPWNATAVATPFAQAREFVYRSGRVLERRLFARIFEDAGPEGVVTAVLAYGNDDGGFGHGLEPDKLTPESQPLDVQFALQTLSNAGAREQELGRRACDFLEALADKGGFVPIILPSVAAHPRAAHWVDGRFPPAISPAIAIAGYLHELGMQHPWLERVSQSCVAAIEREPLKDAHQIHDALVFAEHAPGGESLLPRLAEALPHADYFRRDPRDQSYGLPPTKFPREWFDDDVYDAHLARLESEQQEDGGWPITWEPPGPASVAAWRAIVTIEALRTLETNSRLER
jgi:hypothetical protein